MNGADQKSGTVMRVNGVMRSVSSPPDRLLLDVLREELRLTGTKRGCGIGVCGSCTVLLDGAPRLACKVTLGEVEEREVLTIEGLTGPNGALHPIQQAFIDAGAIQCGFCTPAMVLRAKALLDRRPDPSREEIRRALSPVLCRCTGYQQIVAAVAQAAQVLQTG